MAALGRDVGHWSGSRIYGSAESGSADRYGECYDDDSCGGAGDYTGECDGFWKRNQGKMSMGAAPTSPVNDFERSSGRWLSC
jgi:hypothetical protein